MSTGWRHCTILTYSYAQCNGACVKFALTTCGDVVVNALHGDGGIRNGVSLEVTDKALDSTVNLHTDTQRGILNNLDSWTFMDVV